MESFATPSCPTLLPDRAAYRHASADGRSLMEAEPAGKATDEVRDLKDMSTLDMPTPCFKAAA